MITNDSAALSMQVVPRETSSNKLWGNTLSGGWRHVVPGLLLVFALAGCSRTQPDASSEGTVRIDGSSTVFPITEAVAEEFMMQHSDVRVTVGVSGTGGGFSKLARGEVDISGASRPIQPEEVALAEANGITFIELPVAYDGLALVVHPENDFAGCLTTEELRRIWAPGSTITRWSQVRPGFPDRPLRLYGPGTDSGTYDYFTAAIVGEAGASRSDFTASEDDNVLVQGVAGDPDALGFFGLAYYENNRDRLRLVAVDDKQPDNGAGCIAPSAETVRAGQYQPLARPEFIYVNAARAGDADVQAFVTFYLEHAAPLVEEVGYVPLGDQAYQLALARFQNRTTGSLFANTSPVGLRLDDLLRLETAASQATTAGDSVLTRPQNTVAE